MRRLAQQVCMAMLGGAIAAAVAVGGAAGQGPFEGYDGSNPFNCVLQKVGQGTAFPDPGADPFCVEYDKTHQNVDTLGIADFLLDEPARVAAASDKCFYFQHDHWRSRVVAENEQTETYNWDGSYYFDKAKGVVAAYVENFTINNQTGDPTAFPGFPPEFKPYFGAGRGGGKSAGEIPVDPRCVEKANRENIYAGGSGTGEEAEDGRGTGDPERGPDDRGTKDGRGRDGREPTGSGEDRGSARGGSSGDPGFVETRAEPQFTG